MYCVYCGTRCTMYTMYSGKLAIGKHDVIIYNGDICVYKLKKDLSCFLSLQRRVYWLLKDAVQRYSCND